MSDKNRKTEKPAAENYYELKTDAVERLVNAKSAPEVSYDEINKYTSRGKTRVPSWLKILFIKFWFSGAVCYFVMWGLGLYLKGLDLLFTLAVVLGIVTDIMVNGLLKYFEPEERANDKWMMITVRKFWSIFLNVIYSGAVLFIVIQVYGGINAALTGDPDSVEIALGVEPLLFGLLYMGVDMLLIIIKNTMKKIISDAEKKVSGK